MSKRLNNIFYSKLKFKNMLEAFERASKGKYKNKEVIVFEMDLANQLLNILKSLYNKTYKIAEYREFKIYEPKERLILALPFKDRIVQQWYVEEFIKPIFVPKFIVDSYACIEGRGVHSGVHKLEKYLYESSKQNKEIYALKCDIKKYFYSIDKDILYKIIERKVKDKDFLNLTKMFIYDNSKKTGIPIGNYTSQYYANIYLNELDHYIKEILKIKYYVRYMDDFVILLENKQQCIEILNKIKRFLQEELKLELNNKTNYFKSKQGIVFCGYKVFNGYITLKKENKTKIRKKVKIWNKIYENKNVNMCKANISLNAWLGHAINADTYKLRKKIIGDCKWIYKEN